jgi:hypothetical protein
LGCPEVLRIVVKIDYMRAQVKSKKSESVEARYLSILLSDLRSAITTSIKNEKTEKPVLEFRLYSTGTKELLLSSGLYWGRGKIIGVLIGRVGGGPNGFF